MDVCVVSEELPVISVSGDWREAICGSQQHVLEDHLAGHLPRCRWFAGKAASIVQVRIEEAIRLDGLSSQSCILFLSVGQADGHEAVYTLPLVYVSGQAAIHVSRQHPALVIARLHSVQTGQQGLLCEAFVESSFCADLVELIRRSHRVEGNRGELHAFCASNMGQRLGSEGGSPQPSLVSAEQSNTSVRYGRDLLLKVFRRLAPGVNPEYEMGRFLTAAGFRHIPAVLGVMEYRQNGKEPATVAVLHDYVVNDGDAWVHTLEILGRFFQEIQARPAVLPPSIPMSLLDRAEAGLDPDACKWLGPYAESAQLLGQRTAELHAALASSRQDAAFVPEPFTPLYQESVYQRLHALTESTCRLLTQRMDELSVSDRPVAQRILELKAAILEQFRFLREEELSSPRIRCHGDYHLGQVLLAGSDFVIIDFEGEPALPLGERRAKTSPLRDVSGMVRSFEYAVRSARAEGEKRGMLGKENGPYLESWGQYWSEWTCACFLGAYLQTAQGAGILPQNRREIGLLLGMHLLEKAIYELAYELNNRPDWVSIPLQGILRLAEAAPNGNASGRPCALDMTTDCTCLQERYA